MMRNTFFSEIRRDKESGRLAVIEYQYEPPESGEGPGSFFEVRFRPRLPWRHVLVIGIYLLAVAGVELVMAEDNVKIGVGLLALVVGGFLAIVSVRGLSVEPGRQISDRPLETSQVLVETAEQDDIQEPAEPADQREELLTRILKRALESEKLHRTTARRLAKRDALLSEAIIAFSIPAAIASHLAALSVYGREIWAIIAAAAAGGAAFAAITQRMLRYDIRAEQHIRAAAELRALLDQITQLRLREIDDDTFSGLVMDLQKLTDRFERLSSE